MKRSFHRAGGALPQDVYARVTDKIIKDLERGVAPWVKPWSGGEAAGKIMRPLRSNGIPYTGINILLLWAAAIENGFESPSWITFKQAQALGAHVRKGEHGSLVVFAKTYQKTEKNQETGEDQARDIPFLRAYTVFSVEQVDGLPDHYRA